MENSVLVMQVEASTGTEVPGMTSWCWLCASAGVYSASKGELSLAAVR